MRGRLEYTHVKKSHHLMGTDADALSYLHEQLGLEDGPSQLHSVFASPPLLSNVQVGV